MDNTQVTQWRKKPVVITAVQINTQEDAQRCPGVCTGGSSCKSKGAPDDAWPHIHTLEGDHTWTPGDWCITGVKGERYFCKPDIFAQTYEPAHRLERSEPVGCYRHKKRGTVYEVLGEAELQAANWNVHEGDNLVIYRGEDGKLWARHHDEFHDGRFERIATTPGTTPPEPVAEIERLREALKRLSDERTLQTTIPEGPWTPEMVAEFQSKEVGHMRDLARAALGDAS